MNNNFDKSKAMYQVTIEWDGNTVPSRYYARLHEMGLRVRGKAGANGKEDKTATPIERRFTDGAQGKAVIVQEGNVLCSSESFARIVRGIALNYGARSVLIGTLFIDPEENATNDRDVEYIQRIQAAYGKRGKPGKEMVEQDWVMTCYEDARSFKHFGKHAVMCPNCSGMIVQARSGFMVDAKVPQGVPALEAWERSRFASGTFETPDPNSLSDAPAVVRQSIESQRRVVELIKKSPKLLKVCDMLSPANAITVLDSVFCSRSRIPESVRNNRRLEAVTEFLRNGGDPTKVIIAENPRECDAMDVATVMGSATAAQLFSMSLQ